MREDPCVEIGRQRSPVVYLAARLSRWLRLVDRGRDDLVVGENEAAAGRARHFLPADRRVRAIGADHEPRLENLRRGARLGRKMNANDAIAVARDLLVSADKPCRARFGCAIAQPFVERVAVHHSDKAAAVDRHVDGLPFWRDHGREPHPRLQEVTRNREIADQPRRDRAAARLDASAPVEKRNLAAPAREIVGRSRASGTSADNDEIENLLVIDHGMPFLMVRRQGRPAAPVHSDPCTRRGRPGMQASPLR